MAAATPVKGEKRVAVLAVPRAPGAVRDDTCICVHFMLCVFSLPSTELLGRAYRSAEAAPSKADVRWQPYRYTTLQKT